MKISLVVIGKTNGKFLIEGINEYTKRLSYYIPFNIEYLPDSKNNKKLSEDQQKTVEGNTILNSLDKT